MNLRIADPVEILLVMMGLLMLGAVCASVIFRQKFSEWNQRLAQNMQKYFLQHKKKFFDEGLPDSDMPTLSYDCQKLSPEGHVLEKRCYFASCPTVDEAINSIIFLNNLSEANENARTPQDKNSTST